MRITKPLILIFAVGLMTVFTACNQNDSATTDMKVTSQEVKKEAEQAMDKAVAYTQQQKEEYVQKIETKLEDLDQEIEALTAKAKDNAAELKGESREKFDEALATLKDQKQAAMDKLAELKNASADTWDTVKTGFDDAMHKLEKSVETVKDSFKS